MTAEKRALFEQKLAQKPQLADELQQQFEHQADLHKQF